MTIIDSRTFTHTDDPELAPESTISDHPATAPESSAHRAPRGDTPPPAAQPRTTGALPRPILPRRRIVQLGVFGIFIGTWWAITRFTGVNPVVLPSPGAVLTQLIDTNRCVETSGGQPQCGVQGYYLWQHLLATLQRIGTGLGAGTVTGILLGWALSSHRGLRAIVEPYLSFLRALPPLGYIGLLIVWFGLGNVSMVVLLFLTSFPAITVATLSGVGGIRKDWILGAQTLGASRLQQLRQVIIPGALPEILSGIRIAAGLTWAAIVAAEMNDGIPGIGGLAYVSGTQLDTALTIACIVVIGLTALLLDQILVQISQRCAPWRGHA